MRFTPHTEEEVKEMLETIGVRSLDDLFSAIPQPLLKSDFNLPDGLTEKEAMAKMEEMAAKNKRFLSFLGAGCYSHYIPYAVEAITARGEFATAYTPYQPEASQGTLQVIFEFQSLLCELMQMEVANASMYDGASALAEGILMAKRLSSGKNRSRVLIPRALHPFYRQTLLSYLTAQEIELEQVSFDRHRGSLDLTELKQKLDDKVFAVCFQSPNFFGVVEDGAKIRELVPEEILLIACVNPLSCALFAPPGEHDVDIACGELQALGLPPSYGGPYLGFLVCKREYIRQMPGRIVSETKDLEGRRGFVLTLQTREQHIRREKATSNICTNHQLNALAVSAYMALLGAEGLTERATKMEKNLVSFEEKLLSLGKKPLFSGTKFCETVVPIKERADLNFFYERGILPGLNLRKFYQELPPSLLVYISDEHSEDEINSWINAYQQLFKL